MGSYVDDRSEALGELNAALLDYVHGVEVLEQGEKVIADLKNELDRIKERISSNLPSVLSEGFIPKTIYFAMGDGILKLDYDSLKIEIIKNSMFIGLSNLKKATDETELDRLKAVVGSLNKVFR